MSHNFRLDLLWNIASEADGLANGECAREAHPDSPSFPAAAWTLQPEAGYLVV